MASLGFFESFALGSLAASQTSRENARVAVDVMRDLRDRRQDVGLEGLVNALAAENDALRAELVVLNDYIDRYKQWAEQEIARLERR